MKQLITISFLCCIMLTLSSCVVPEKIIITFHIAIGGGGWAQVDQLDFKSTEAGVKGEHEIADFIVEFNDENEEGESSDDIENNMFAGATNFTKSIGYDEEGKLNTQHRGEFANLFGLIQAMNMGDELDPDRTFTVDWNGDMLTISIGWPEENEDDDDAAEAEADDVAEPDDDDDEEDESPLSGVEFIITTDGEFAFASLGKISPDRKRLVLNETNVTTADVRQGKFEIRVRGLAGQSQ